MQPTRTKYLYFFFGMAGGLALGAAIGFIIFQSQLSGLDSHDDPFHQDNVGFYAYGLVKRINASELILDQTFNRSYDGDNPSVKISLKEGASLLTCEFYSEGPTRSACGPVNLADIPIGTYSCAQSRIVDGEIVGGKIFFNATCGEINPFPS
jgi:hypothetical protein